MKKLILATNNKNKVREIKQILNSISINILSLKDIDIDIDVKENGSSFKENSLIKAREIAKVLLKKNYKDFIVMADDSGLEVPFLGGEPGIYSARYSGTHGDDNANNKKLLSRLNGAINSDRKAFFKCAIALVNYDEKEMVIEDSVEGMITEKEQGESGFGYDPLFYYEPLKKTFGELSEEEKNYISHRAKALSKLKTEILKLVK